MSVQPAAACKLVGTYTGSFTAELGESRFLVGWPAIQMLDLNAGRMGDWPDPLPEDSHAVMSLDPFTGNTANRSKIRVTIDGDRVQIDREPVSRGIGMTVMNQPFWMGVFEGRCGFDLHG